MYAAVVLSWCCKYMYCYGPVCKVSTAFPHGFKLSIQPAGILWFWYLHNVKLYAKQKEMISDESFCFGHAQWSWLLNERLVSSGTAQGFVQFLLWLLDDQVTLFTLFLLTKTPHYYWNNSDLNKQDLALPDITTHSETTTLFIRWPRSTSLGVGGVGT